MNAILIDLPTRVKGYTVENEDGTYSVFLNARMASNQIRETYRHEVEHIKRMDFEKEQVQRIEAYAHSLKSCGISG